MRWCLLLLGCVCLEAADVPRLYYSKSFPGSVPAFVAITLDKTGAGEYKEAQDDDRPLRFQLSEPESAEIRVERMRTMVVLPAPFGPKRATMAPWSTVRSTWSSTR